MADLPAHRRLYQARAVGALLDRHEVTTGDLTRRLGVTKQVLSKWLTGRVVIPAYWVARIGNELALTPEEVVVLLTSAALVDWERRGGAESGLPDPYRRH